MAKVELSKEELLTSMSAPESERNMFLDAMLRRFKKKVINEGILEECKRREFFLKKSLKRKEKSKRAKIALILASKGKVKRKQD